MSWWHLPAAACSSHAQAHERGADNQAHQCEAYSPSYAKPHDES